MKGNERELWIALTTCNFITVQSNPLNVDCYQTLRNFYNLY